MKSFAWACLVLGLLMAVPVALKAQEGSSAAKVELGRNYPNPFNPETFIPFAIPGSAFAGGHRPVVSVRIYNVLAQLVAIPILQGSGDALEMVLARKVPREPEVGQGWGLFAVRAVEAMARGCHDVWGHAEGRAHQARALAEQEPNLLFQGQQPGGHVNAIIAAEHRHGVGLSPRPGAAHGRRPRCARRRAGGTDSGRQHGNGGKPSGVAPACRCNGGGRRRCPCLPLLALPHA